MWRDRPVATLLHRAAFDPDETRASPRLATEILSLPACLALSLSRRRYLAGVVARHLYRMARPVSLTVTVALVVASYWRRG